MYDSCNSHMRDKKQIMQISHLRKKYLPLNLLYIITRNRPQIVALVLIGIRRKREEDPQTLIFISYKSTLVCNDKIKRTS